MLHSGTAYSLALICTLTVAQSARATVQVTDMIRFKGQDGWVQESPLEGLWKVGSQRPEFDEISTAERKGYTAAWEVREGNLYLVAFQAQIDGKRVAIDRIIPGAKLPVHADWYTGMLHVGVGQHRGYSRPFEPRFERSYAFQVLNGNIARRGLLIMEQGNHRNVHLVGGDAVTPLTRFRNPHHIYAAEMSPSGAYVFVWHMDYPPRRLMVFEIPSGKMIADFVPGVAGELLWSADDRIIHLFGFGTGHYSRMYDVNGNSVRYGSGGGGEFDLDERADPYMHPSRRVIVYIPGYKLAPAQVTLVRTSDGAILRVGPERMVARDWEVKDDRIRVSYTVSAEPDAPIHQVELRIPDDWVRNMNQ